MAHFEVDGTAGVQWKDVSTFSRSQTDRTPHTWEATFPLSGIRITVMRKHLHYPGRFVFSSNDLGIYTARVLEGTTKETAAQEAFLHCLQLVQRMAVDFGITPAQ
jgi:hypothetical protein